MINSTHNSSPYEAVQAAIVGRLMTTGERPDVYDLDYLARQFPTPAAVTGMDQSSWSTLLTGSEVEDQTAVPCPPECRYPAQHHFESEDDDGRQVRWHAIRIDTPRGVDLSLTQEEKRERGDDSTVTRGPVRIWATVDIDDLDASTARRIAGVAAERGRQAGRGRRERRLDGGRAVTTAEGVATIDPCPLWCELQPGHGYDDEIVEPDRTHRRTVGERVTIDQIEYLEMSPDGIRTSFTPARAFVLTPPGEELNAEEAEQIGRELIEAARILRAISA